MEFNHERKIGAISQSVASFVIMLDACIKILLLISCLLGMFYYIDTSYDENVCNQGFTEVFYSVRVIIIKVSCKVQRDFKMIRCEW